VTPVPEHVLALREKIGHALLWLPAVTAVVRHPERAEVLLVRRADNGAWTPITGIVDPGEQPAVAAAREALEETGTVVRVDRLAATAASGVVTHVNGDRAAYLDQTFACTWVSGEAHVADDESVDVRWWPLDGLPDLSRSHLDRLDAALSDEREARFIT
jgi:8-oxo-dGTP pyrophosphatase MutT (NUDIX family)